MRVAEHSWNKLPLEYQRGSTVSIGVSFGYDPKLHNKTQQWKMHQNTEVEITGRDNLHSYDLSGIYWDCSMTGIADKVCENRKKSIRSLEDLKAMMQKHILHRSLLEEHYQTNSGYQ